MPDNYIITPKDFLYRRFPILEEPRFISFWKWEKGKKVPTSAAFKTKQDEDGLSVDIAILTSPEKTSGDFTMFGVAEFSASVPLNEKYECIQDKKPTNDAHALIVGDTNPIAKKLSKAVTNIYL